MDLPTLCQGVTSVPQYPHRDSNSAHRLERPVSSPIDDEGLWGWRIIPRDRASSSETNQYVNPAPRTGFEPVAFTLTG